LKQIVEKQVERTIEALEKNKMAAVYVESKDKVIDAVKAFMQEGETVGVGGSMTLFETGIIDYLRSGRYNFLDRYAPGLTNDEMQEIYRKSFLADTYITSTNAITEDGELYCVDGNGNRVAAMIYGPKSVIVVAGINKIVKDYEAAVDRVRRIASPANATRLSCKTPCVKMGICQDCRSDMRICCSYTVFRQQRFKNRIKCIIVGEELGY
jgi:L-lactate utilization protein LutB